MNQARFGNRPFLSQALMMDIDKIADLFQGRFPGFPVNVRETEDGLEFHAFVPGVGKDSIDVRMKEQTLVIRVQGTSTNDTAADSGRWLQEEVRRPDEAERRFRVPVGFDTTQIKARQKDGVLVVTLPRSVASESPSVTIED